MVKFIFTNHAIEKFSVIENLGWHLTKARIKNTIQQPKWTGVTKQNQTTAMQLVDENHIVRVVFRQEDDTITVITFHIARRGKYESTLR